MKEILRDIQKNKGKNNLELLGRIKEVAIKEGFPDRKSRKEIYSFVLQLNDNYKLKQVLILSPRHTFKLKEKGIILPIYVNNSQRQDCFKEYHIDTLRKDLPRCIYHHLKQYDRKIFLDLDNFEKCVTHMLLSETLQYSYYQGYLDICVHFFLLFQRMGKRNTKNNRKINRKNNKQNKSLKAIAAINRFTEIFIKDYITIPDKDNDVFIQATNFLTDLINLKNNVLGEKLKKDNCCLCMSLSWVLTFKMHDINDPNKLYRLLDYLIVAEPYAIYVLSSLIIHDTLIDENVKGQRVSIDSQSGNEDFYKKMSGIDFNSINYDKYIKETHEFIDKNKKGIDIIRKKYVSSLKTICDTNYNGIKDYLSNEIEPRTIEKQCINKKQDYRTFNILITIMIFLFIIIASYFLSPIYLLLSH